jgi:hypothetical protein
MKTTNIQIALALLAGAVATAREPQGPPGRRPPPVPPVLAIFDVDRDGVLSEKEIAAAAEALGKLDRNGDGEITMDEMRPPKPDGEGPQGPPPGHRPPPPVIAALDTDKDGTISAEELKAAPESLLTLDENGDGALSPQELHPHGPPPPREGGPDGDGGPQGPPPDGDPEGPMEGE